MLGEPEVILTILKGVSSGRALPTQSASLISLQHFPLTFRFSHSLLPCVRAVVSTFFDIQFPTLAPNIFFCFSDHQGTLCSSYFFPSSIWHKEESNSFLEYVQSNWLFYAGYCLEVPDLSYTFKNFFITYFLWPFYLLHSPPAPHFEALQILPLQFFYFLFIFCSGFWATQFNAPNITPN